ncbi:family 20 glycosylhydrolase [Gilvimarinus xylanilyticus]|uniref:beta-N-acetylhexosaminidase n=1 Tax=Gilvimarinus xylanilyticus TaxID=2944139 RepID=A0A9X2HX93_9GAMM|nr:family 20 glycosylhydrolase [Gilvimarinus xylanilyticus]MCP8899344.1 carbohydate-binding domain-containing protein [Gilvimarinus xylanilyticus]
MRYLMASLLLCGALVAQAVDWTQAQLADFTQATSVRFAVVSNVDERGKHMRLTLHNHSQLALPASDWAVYFHSVRKLEAVAGQNVTIEHVQGDLHRLLPGPSFDGLGAGEALEVDYLAAAHMVSYTDFMPRAFLVMEGLKPEVFTNTDTENIQAFVEPIATAPQQKRSARDQFAIASAQSRFQANADLPELDPEAAKNRIIPAPQSVKTRRGSAELSSAWQLRYAGGLKSEAEYFNQRLQAHFGFSLPMAADHLAAEGPTIYLRVATQADKNSSLPVAPESYHLQVDDEHIVIAGRDAAGAFYGAQSLLALMYRDDGDVRVDNTLISDSPRTAWRGMHYDMGRNFHGKAVTLRLIEQMGRYKLNKLHLHLTEDEGWRLQIPGLPQLTDIGAQRCFDLSEQRCLLTQLGTGPHTSGSGNGYYKRADFIEILRYAAARHIEVIPEIDMPGHARAAIKSMEARYQQLLEAGKEQAARQYLLSDPEDQSEYLTVQNYTDNSVNVCLESTYAFIDKVMYELQQMYREAGLKLDTFHMGGDEVGKGSWTRSPVCEQLFTQQLGVAGPADLKPYFVSRVSQLAEQRGMDLMGWEDGLMYDRTNTFNREQFVNDKVIANAWDNIWEWGVADRAYRLANNGYQVVLTSATHLYFDHPYEVHPAERGYYWAARATSLNKVFSYLPDDLYANADYTRDGVAIKNLEALVGRPLPALQKPENIIGMQGAVWSETIRSADQLEPMLYPRLLALAERAWHQADWEETGDSQARRADYTSFLAALIYRELPRMQRAGVGVYLPPPGAQWQGDELRVNNALPGVSHEYSQDGGDTWVSKSPSKPDEGIWVRARLGEQFSRPTSVPAP